MRNAIFVLAAAAVLSGSVSGAPQPSETVPLERGLVSGLLNRVSDAVKDGDGDGVLDAMHGLVPTKTPKSVEEASAIIESIAATASPSSLAEYNAQLMANGILFGTVDQLFDLFDYAEGLVSEENSFKNSNPDLPNGQKIYPKRSACDAPYTTSESDLRSAIYIPDGFTYGDKLPVVLFPGTGATGYTTFAGNFIPLLTDVEWADPVWVNVPGLLNDDAQINSEYAAYAINYISALTGRNTSVIAWSQGNIDTQWAFKYWPSTRRVTSDHVAISADYRGTVLANFAGLVGVINTPAVVQQQAGSDFITTLRADGGDSGYVPTTSIFSGFLDEIVQPQSGVLASAFLLDARGVGVTNSEVQKVCFGQIGGSLYTHEGLLANPLAFALAKDALTHDGPGRTGRLDLGAVCDSYLAPGLDLADFLVTENAILVAGLSLLTYQPKVFKEPAVMEYASSAGVC